MARTVIPTNFQDDELAEEMQGRRRYRQILNADGTVSFEDVTDYDTEGSTFGASRVNEMAQNINESADVNKIIDDLEDISVVTQNGFIAGAKAVKTLNNNLSNNVVGFPDFANPTTILGNTGTYTITQNGWLKVYMARTMNSTATSPSVKVNGTVVAQLHSSTGIAGGIFNTYMVCPVKAGDIITATKAAPDEISVVFYPNR